MLLRWATRTHLQGLLEIILQVLVLGVVAPGGGCQGRGGEKTPAAAASIWLAPRHCIVLRFGRNGRGWLLGGARRAAIGR